MTKLTLDDFYSDPRKAYANGFRLTWKHSIIKIIKYTFVTGWVDIFKLAIELTVDCLIPMLLILLKMMMALLIITTMPIFFPIWVVLHQLDLRKTIKEHFEDDYND